MCACIDTVILTYCLMIYVSLLIKHLKHSTLVFVVTESNSTTKIRRKGFLQFFPKNSILRSRCQTQKVHFLSSPLLNIGQLAFAVVERSYFRQISQPKSHAEVRRSPNLRYLKFSYGQIFQSNEQEVLSGN